MATVWVDPPTHSATINAANTYVLRPAAHGVIGRWKIDVVSSSFVGSVTVKARQAGTANTFVPVPYTKLYLNGAVGDGTQVSSAITSDSVIEVVSEGMDIALDCTSFTSGSLALTARPVIG